jgi:hypothetical protein
MTGKELDALRTKTGNFVIINGILFKRAVDGVPRRVLGKEQTRLRILYELHDGSSGGHRGREGTARKVGAVYWWPRWYNDVAKYVEECSVCQKRGHGRIKEPLHPTKSDGVFRKVHVDLIVLPRSRRGNEYVVVAVDDLTGWTEGSANAYTIFDGTSTHGIYSTTPQLKFYIPFKIDI